MYRVTESHPVAPHETGAHAWFERQIVVQSSSADQSATLEISHMAPGKRTLLPSA